MMMHCLGSSSSGNCYILRSSTHEALIIECGVKFQNIQRAIDWKPENVAGCIISHRHRDHCASLKDVIKNGIQTYAHKDVFDSFNLRTRTFCNEIQHIQKVKIGKYNILPLNVMHDVPCFAFIITHPEMGNLFFVTDTMYVEYRINNLNHIMIEANYSDEILQYNIDNGIEPRAMRDRLLNTHMELKTTLKVLSETDLKDVNEVILLHLSHRNSDSEAFKASVEQNIIPTVEIASSALKINLNKEIY